MKNLLGILGICILLSSCGPDYKIEVERMMRERDSLMAQYDAKDSVINGYMQDISEIQTSIDGLTRQEEMLSRSAATDPEASPDAKTKILNDVEAIRQMIDQNKKKLGELQSRIKKNNVKIGELETMIKSLNTQLASKDSSINSMNEKIMALNGTITTMQTSIDTMASASAAKTAVINEKTMQLNTAYYTVDSYKNLRDKKVLTKQGGFLGLGKEKTLMPDFNSDVFTKIDVTSTKTIAITGGTKSTRLLSTHPSGTYNFKRENDKVTGIEITDADKFWKASKYLVVVTE